MSRKYNQHIYDNDGNIKAILDYEGNIHYVKVVLLDRDNPYVVHVFDRDKSVEAILEQVEMSRKMEIPSESK